MGQHRLPLFCSNLVDFEVFELHFGLMHIWTIWRILVFSSDLEHCLMNFDVSYDLEYSLANFAVFMEFGALFGMTCIHKSLIWQSYPQFEVVWTV